MRRMGAWSNVWYTPLLSFPSRDFLCKYVYLVILWCIFMFLQLYGVFSYHNRLFGNLTGMPLIIPAFSDVYLEPYLGSRMDEIHDLDQAYRHSSGITNFDEITCAGRYIHINMTC